MARVGELLAFLVAGIVVFASWFTCVSWRAQARPTFLQGAPGVELRINDAPVLHSDGGQDEADAAR